MDDPDLLAYSADAYAMADGETPGRLERIISPFDLVSGAADIGVFDVPRRRERHAVPHAPLCQVCGVRGCRSSHRR